MNDALENKIEPSLNEIFTEQISMLRPINPARYCGICGGQGYVGFNVTPAGTKQLTKCVCSTFGISEYGRIQDHLHAIEANMTGQMQVLLNNMQKLADYQERTVKSVVNAQRQSYVGTLEVLEVLNRNTFWGGIKFGIGVVIMFAHDGWLFIKKGFEQLKREKGNGEAQSLSGAQDTNIGRADNVLEMPDPKRAGVE